MNTLLVLAIAVGVAAADVGTGYHYKVPQTSYGVPSYQGSSSSGSSSSSSSSNSNNNNGYYTSVGSSQGQYLGSSQEQYLGSNQGQYLGSNQGQYLGSLGAPSYGSGFESFGSGSTLGSSGFGSSGFGSSDFGLSGSSFGSSGSSFGSSGSSFGSAGSSFGSSDFGSSDLSSSGLGFGSSYGTGLGSGYFESSTLQPIFSVTGSSEIQSSNQFQSSSANKYQENYQYVTQPAQVFKHFYVHAAPEEPEIPKPKQPIVLPPPQKHYKIIFIKAPSQNYAPPVIPVQQQNEEKTIVYVLVKKPEDAQNIVLPQLEPKAPSKPEVFFIKYNNKDSQAVINNIVNDYNKGGASVNYNAGEQQAIVTGGNLNLGSSLGSLGSSEFVSGSSGGFESSSISSGQSLSSSSLGVTGSPLVTVSTIDNGSSIGEYESGSTASSSASAITGGLTESSTLSTSNFDNSNLISTSQGVPHETYGPPKFRS